MAKAPPAAPTPPAVKPLWEVVPDGKGSGKLVTHMHEGQLRAWDSEARFVFILAGAQSGKTSWGPLWLWREIMQKGPGDYMAVTSTFPLLQLKMLPEFLKLFDHTLHLGTWHAADRVYVFRANYWDDTKWQPYVAERGPTRVIFGSASKPESLESATARGVWCDEVGQDEWRLESWNAIQRRIALNRARVLGTTTLYNVGWMKQQIYDRWHRGEKDYEVIQFPSTMNPAFSQDEFDLLSSEWEPWRVNMFLRGEYDKPPGLIYGSYIDSPREEGGHLVRPFDIPASWPRYGGLDFGGVHTARLLLAYDHETDVYYLYSEDLSGGKTTKEHVAEALAATQGVNMKSWHGGSGSEDQWRWDWRAAGITVHEPVVNDVETGIERVIALFKGHRLYIFDTLTGIRDELGTYSRELGEDGEPIDKIKNKAAYHRIDALRMVGQALSLPPKVAVPFTRREGPAIWTPPKQGGGLAGLRKVIAARRMIRR